jgi:hypothetical protein
MPEVVLTRRAAARIREDLKDPVATELTRVFPEETIVLVQECLEGYSRDQEKKLILAVEVHKTTSPGDRVQTEYAAHVVKLGDTGKVSDHKRWVECFGMGSIASHIFLPLRHHDLDDGGRRAAVVYADARQQTGDASDDGGIRTLESAAEQSIKGQGIRLESIERVISQVYSELKGLLYEGASEDPSRATVFYKSKLGLGDGAEPVADRWRGGEMLRLRKEVLWLFCNGYQPDDESPHCYVDPYDYLLWALGERGKLPDTLVGRSHGDLHGRNVLVVIRLDEAERPTVIDYNDMRRNNVLAWDFVKLEMELKAHLLAPLFHKAKVRADWLAAAQAIWPVEVLGHVLQAWKLRRSKDELAQRLERLLCAYFFEKALAQFTGELHRANKPEQVEPPSREHLTTIPELDNLLLLLWTVRRQAACVLGTLPARGNPKKWFDEYQFALAAYGLHTAKFTNYDVYQRAMALVSAGMAVGCLGMPSSPFEQPHKPELRVPTATYQVAMNKGYKLWARKGEDALQRAVQTFKKVDDRFGYAVPFVREYALVLASQNHLPEARKVLEGLVDSPAAASDKLNALAEECCSFGDFETLCRIGRIYKDQADKDWEESQVLFKDLASSDARQFYHRSWLFYKMAFDISHAYFPGENAAITALLAGEPSAQALAIQVLVVCDQAPRSFSRGDLWLFCTIGIVSLLTGDMERAKRSFAKALEVFEREGRPAGMMQSAYNTLCRLYEALGPAAVLPVVELLGKAGVNLDKGPLTACGRKPRAAAKEIIPKSWAKGVIPKS